MDEGFNIDISATLSADIVEREMTKSRRKHATKGGGSASSGDESQIKSPHSGAQSAADSGSEEETSQGVDAAQTALQAGILPVKASQRGGPNQDASQGGADNASNILGPAGQRNAQSKAPLGERQNSKGEAPPQLEATPQSFQLRSEVHAQAEKSEHLGASSAQAADAAQGLESSAIQPAQLSAPNDRRLVEMSATQLELFRKFQVFQEHVNVDDYQEWRRSKAAQAAAKPASASQTKQEKGRGASVTFSEAPAPTFKPKEPALVSRLQKSETHILVRGDSEEDDSPSPRGKGHSASGSPKKPQGSSAQIKDTGHRSLTSKTAQKPRKPKEQAAPKCPRCASTNADHDWVRCKKPLHNGPRSADELAFLNSLTKVERAATKARVQIKKAAREDSQSEGDDLEESDSDSREEENEYESEGLDDEDEEEEDVDDEDDENDEAESDPEDDSSKADSSAASKSHSPPSKRKPKKAEAPQAADDDRISKLETVLQNLVNVVQVMANGPRPKITTSTHTPAAHGRGNFPSHSSLTSATGMEGCPEIPREDLMNLEKFEKYETKYKEYLDKATDRRRTYHKMTHGFRKYHNEVRAAIRSLFDKSWQLRDAYRGQIPGFDMSESEFLDLNNTTFAALYKELCTHKSFLPSQLLQKLEQTVFERTGSLPAVVIQASTAFREHLRGLPRQTVDSCTPKQLKEAFIKMLLGSDERNIADFPSTNTWEEVVSRLLDLEGSSQAHTILTRVSKARKGDSTTAGDSEESPSSSITARGRGGSARGGQATSSSDKNSPKEASVPDESWQEKFEELKAKYKPTDVELLGCTTYNQKVKRILQIRDTRAREDEMKALRTAITSEPTPRQKPGNSPAQAGATSASPPSKSQLSQDAPKCYNCGLVGHIAKDCSEPRKQRRGDSPARHDDA